MHFIHFKDDFTKKIFCLYIQINMNKLVFKSLLIKSNQKKLCKYINIPTQQSIHITLISILISF